MSEAITPSNDTNNTGTSQPAALRFFAHVVSYVCHPVFFPLVMAFALYELAPAGFMGLPPRQLGLWFISIGVTAVGFPLFTILLLKPLGFISSYQMPTARERTIPLMAIMIFYFWVTHVFNNMPGPPVPLVLKVLLLGNFWGVIIIFMINIFTKISLHTTVAGAMIGIIVVLMIISPGNMIVPFFVALVIAGIMGTARMILGAHERGDIWLGYFVGILVQLCAYLYMR